MIKDGTYLVSSALKACSEGLSIPKISGAFYYTPIEKLLGTMYRFPTLTEDAVDNIALLSGAVRVANVDHYFHPFGLDDLYPGIAIQGAILNTGYFIFWPTLVFKIDNPIHARQQIGNIEDLLVTKKELTKSMKAIRYTHFLKGYTIENAIWQSFPKQTVRKISISENVESIIRELKSIWPSHRLPMPEESAKVFNLEEYLIHE